MVSWGRIVGGTVKMRMASHGLMRISANGIVLATSWWDSERTNGSLWLLVGSIAIWQYHCMSPFDSGEQLPMESRRLIVGGTAKMRIPHMSSLESVLMVSFQLLLECTSGLLWLIWFRDTKCRWHRKDQLFMGQSRCECLVWAHWNQCQWYHHGHFLTGQCAHEWFVLALGHYYRNLTISSYEPIWFGGENWQRYRKDRLLVGQWRCECLSWAH